MQLNEGIVMFLFPFFFNFDMNKRSNLPIINATLIYKRRMCNLTCIDCLIYLIHI